ncbi:MAG TPA: glycosyltransferase family 9 protein [Nocardioidaceae bacterium]|nr:glycosyltransferase family 9 protein [Nocardioidaceae bacterium]
MSGRTGDVLVLRALGLGDALTGIAALRGVRRAWPERRLVLATGSGIGEWLRGLGVIDAVLTTSGLAPLRAGALQAHVGVNLHGRGPQSHRVLQATRPAELVAFECPEVGHLSGPQWRRDEHEVARWCRLVTGAGGACGPEDLRLAGSGSRGDVVVVHPGAASAARHWPAERWREVVRTLGGSGRRIAVTGTTAEAELCEQVAAVSAAATVARDLPLDQLGELVASAALLLSGDTGVAHLATAYATPSVTLFGPTPPIWWGPALDPHLHTVLWPGRAGELGDPHADVVDPRLAAITVDEVLTAAYAQLAR